MLNNRWREREWAKTGREGGREGEREREREGGREGERETETETDRQTETERDTITHDSIVARHCTMYITFIYHVFYIYSYIFIFYELCIKH